MEKLTKRSSWGEEGSLNKSKRHVHLKTICGRAKEKGKTNGWLSESVIGRKKFKEGPTDQRGPEKKEATAGNVRVNKQNTCDDCFKRRGGREVESGQRPCGTKFYEQQQPERNGI